MPTNLHIRRAAPTDIAWLLPLAKASFYTTYAHLNRPENMDHYLQKAFTREQWTREFAEPASHFYAATLGESPVGYTKLNFGAAQTELQDDTALEIERIYVFEGFQGRGIGRQLIEHAVGLARERGLQYVWLGVWEKNPAAIAFYERVGFSHFGEHIFQFGDDAQTDVMMRRDL